MAEEIRETHETTESFTLTRTYEAPRELLWRAWTDPALLSRWWHPAGVEVEPGSVTVELREGGAYTYTMVAPQGSWPVGGTYLEVHEPERLRFTWRGIDEADEAAPVATVDLSELGTERTEMTFTLERRARVEAAEDEGVRDGWRSAFDDVLLPLLEELP
jgi:uncharacterized protein YndB with AHSA1/START domain